MFIALEMPLYLRVILVSTYHFLELKKLFYTNSVGMRHLQSDRKYKQTANILLFFSGDFNFPSHKDNQLTYYLKTILRLKQVINGPTFIRSRNTNTIDHVYVPMNLEEVIQCRFNYYSDHMSFNISFK